MPRISSIAHRDLRTIESTDTLAEAATQLHGEGVGLLLVVEQERMVGVLSERDVVRALAEGEDLEQAHVFDAMTEDVETVPSSAGIEETGRRMLDNEIRHIVVTEDGEPTAIVGARDILAALIGATV